MHDIFMRFPEGKAKVLTLSYDDGAVQDKRLIKIMLENGLRGTFNINSGLFGQESVTVGRRMTTEEAVSVYRESGMEVAVHTLTHPHLEQLPEKLCVKEVAQDRDNLEKLFGSIIRGMAYPFGTTNDSVINALRKSRIAYARTTVATEKFDMPTDWLKLPTTCHHTNPRLMKLANTFMEKEILDNPQMFYLWGHSFEFDYNLPNNNWGIIEEFARHIGNHADIWYATNLEIFDYIAAYNQLLFSMDYSTVSNPSCMNIYFKVNNATYRIRPGETIHIRN